MAEYIKVPAGVYDMVTRCMEQEFPDRVAIRYVAEDGKTVVEKKYREYAQDIRRMTAYLKAEVPDIKGRRIVLLSRNCYEFCVASFGIILAGGVLVTLNQKKTWDELEYELGLVEPALILNDGIDYGCRAELEAAGRRPCIRLRCTSQNYAFEDAVFGPFSMTLEACGGDFALRRSDGVIAYQLAVVVDDGLMGITQVVRGEDLLVSTPRQLALFDLLGYPRPAYMHLPLLCDPEGERLAKRHASLTLASLRDAGVSPAAVAGYLGWKAGLIGALAPAHPRNLLPAFDPGRLRFLPERVLVEADLTALLSVVC